MNAGLITVSAAPMNLDKTMDQIITRNVKVMKPVHQKYLGTIQVIALFFLRPATLLFLVSGQLPTCSASDQQLAGTFSCQATDAVMVRCLCWVFKQQPALYRSIDERRETLKGKPEDLNRPLVAGNSMVDYRDSNNTLQRLSRYYIQSIACTINFKTIGHVVFTA